MHLIRRCYFSILLGWDTTTANNDSLFLLKHVLGVGRVHGHHLCFETSIVHVGTAVLMLQLGPDRGAELQASAIRFESATLRSGRSASF